MSSEREHAFTLVAHFLGSEATTGTLQAILGLPSGLHEPEVVSAALQRQLDRISQHPDGTNDAADEVRLALFTASSQLTEEFRRVQAGAPAAAPNAPVPGQAISGFREEAMLIIAQDGGFNDDTLRRLTALAHRRGLTASDAVAMLASVGGVLPARAPSVDVVPNASPKIDTRISLPPHDAEDEPLRAIDAETKRVIREAMWIGGFLLTGAIGLVILAVVIFTNKRSAGTSPTTPPPAPAAAANMPNTNTPAQTDTNTSVEQAVGADIGAIEPEPAMTDPADVLAWLRSAAASAKSPTGTATINAANHLSIFARAVTAISQLWPRYDLAQRRAIDDAIIEYVYAVAASPDVGARAVDLIAEPSRVLGEETSRVKSDQVWPAAWSAGMLARLASERNLPRIMTQPIEHDLAAAVGVDRSAVAPSGAGIEGALRRISLRLVVLQGTAQDASEARRDSEKAVQKWLDAAHAVNPAGGDAAENSRERLMIDALESLMVFAPESDERIDVYGAIGSIAAATAWREGGPARARLLDWLRDPRISASDVRVLTSAIVGRSPAKNLDPSMVLSAGVLEGGTQERARLREAYARSWRVGAFASGSSNSSERETVLSAWATAVHALIDAQNEKAPPEQALWHAARLSMLHEAAWAIWDGDSARAKTLIDDATKDLPQEQATAPDAAAAPNTAHYTVTTPSATTPTTTQRPSESTEWALSYFQAERNIPLRVKRLEELESRGGDLGRVEAGVLAEAAVIGSPELVRFTAQRVAKHYADQAALSKAMLDVLPRAPRIEPVSDLVQAVSQRQLPPTSDPRWSVLARRALVERLIELLAANGKNEGLGVDADADTIRRSYMHAAGLGLTDTHSTAENHVEHADVDVLVATAALLTRLRRDAEAYAPSPGAPVPLAEVLRRAGGRRALARGPVQAFAADQTESLDLLAYAVCGERPGRAADIGKLYETASTRRRACTHIFAQVRENEASLLKLWLVRFGLEVKP